MEVTRQEQARRESRAIAAAWSSFFLGTAAGLVALVGEPRPISGDGAIALPAAGIAAIVTAAAFAASTLVHRRAETAPMPRWQQVVSNVSTIALTIAFAAVAYIGTLTGSLILGQGLQGLELPWIGGALLTGVASTAGGWLAWQAGVELRTKDLATLLFAYLTIGTVFAMLTAVDPRWWEQHFSALGAGGPNAWAFNLTVVVAGLLVATIGSYIGRDLHRWLGDASLRQIAWVVGLFGLTGLALAGVGIFPVHRAEALHNIAALGTLVLFGITAVVVTIVMPGPPRAMLLTTIGAGVAIAATYLLWTPLGVLSVAAVEAIAVGILFVWLTTLVRTVAAGAPDASRPSQSPTPLGAGRPAA